MKHAQDTSYDYGNRVMLQSRPYCSQSDQTYDSESFTYDALGRVTYYEWNYDNDSQISGTYFYPSINSAIEQTPDGNNYQRTYDASGHLISVLEPSDTDQSGQAVPAVETDYNYDALGRLVKIQQLGDPNHTPQDPVLPRQFSYNSLSELISAYNPESGTTSYTYDLNGNTQTFTDNRGITTLNCYDHLNRLLSESTTDSSCSSFGQSSNPYISFGYDTSVGGVSQSNLTGRLSSAHAFTENIEKSTEVYSYDQMGRTTATYEKLPSEQGGSYHSTSFIYNYAGSPKQITYPSGRIISNQWNSLNQLVSAHDVSGVTYISNYSHNPDGSDSQFTYANGATSVITRDSRSRILEQSVSVGALGTIMDNSYGYGQESKPGPGILRSASDFLNNSFAMFYSYDTLGRISGFNYYLPTNQMSQAYSYTASGNIMQSNTNWPSLQIPQTSYGPDNKFTPNSTFCSASPLALGVDPNNTVYDLAGNLLCDGVAALGYANQYIYDAPGRLAQIYSGGSLAGVYTYSAEGNRVRKDTPATGAFKEYVWAGGSVLSEHSSTGAWTDFIYANGRKIAKVDGTGTHYYLADAVGTTQMEMDAYGNVTWQGQFSPFGQELDQAQTAMNYKFTGQERDAESGDDNFGARYYGSFSGRFISPDPSGLMYTNPANPQSLNLYGYVINNPLTYVDPTGKTCQTNSTDGTTYDDLDGKGCKAVDDADAAMAPSAIVNANNSQDLAAEEEALEVNRDITSWLVRQGVQYQTGPQIAPVAKQFVQDVAKKTAGFPNICSISASARVQIPGTPVSAGVNVDGDGNVSSSASWKQAGGGGSPSISLTGRAGANGGAFGQQISVPIADTGVNATIGINPGKRTSYGVSTGSVVTAGASATFGGMGDPSCQKR